MPSIYKDNVIPINLHNYIKIVNSNTGLPLPVIYESQQVISNSTRAKVFTISLPIIPIIPAQVIVSDQANGTVRVNAGTGNNQEAIRPINELPLLSGSIDNTADKLVLWDASTNTHVYTTPAVINAPEVFRNNGVLTGVAPVPYKVGIDYSTGTQYYVNTAGNWQAFPAGTTVVLTDLPNGQLNINAGLGGIQNTIRPIAELTPLIGAVDDMNDRIPMLDSSTGDTIYVNPSAFKQDFFRMQATNTLPDGFNDVAKNIYHSGAVVIGSTNNLIPNANAKLQVDNGNIILGLPGSQVLFNNYGGDPFCGIKGQILPVALTPGKQEVNELLLYSGNDNSNGFGADRVKLSAHEIRFCTTATTGAANSGEVSAFYENEANVPLRMLIQDNGDVQIVQYPNTRNDTNPINFLGTTSTGLVQSYNTSRLASTILPLADGVGDTRAGQAGVSNIFAREDHIHPVVRLNQLNLPVFSAGGFFTFTSQALLRQYTTIEAQYFSIRVTVNTNGVGQWGTINVPNIAGYTLVSTQFAQPYDATGGSLAYATRPAFVFGLNTIYAQTAISGRSLVFDVDLTYIIN